MATKGRTLEAFKMAHDKSVLVPAKIKTGLAELGDSWEYEVEFIRRCGLSTGDFAAYRAPFLEHSVEIKASTNRGGTKRVWAGSKAFAARLRERIE